jgi:hypothetical protein
VKNSHSTSHQRRRISESGLKPGLVGEALIKRVPGDLLQDTVGEPDGTSMSEIIPKYGAVNYTQPRTTRSSTMIERLDGCDE